jgi:FLVCR family MFS transporter 7
MYVFQLWIITGPSLLVMFMATFGICSSVPPTPPTSSAEEKSEPFFEGLKQVFVTQVHVYIY